MKILKKNLIVASSFGLIFLGACSNDTQTTTSTSSPASSPAETTAQNSPVTSAEAANTNSNSESKGRQVIESGPYHLEFVAEPEDNGTHIDFYLQSGDNHEAISNANVTAQIQLPDGSQKELPLSYDPEGKHYTVLLPEKVAGEYKVAVLSEIKGEKVNGRFTFNR